MGWVLLDTVGTDGAVGTALITASIDADEVQLTEFLTVKVYVLLGANPLNVAVVPVPLIVVPP